LTRAPEATAPFRWIWKSPCPPKQKFFFSGWWLRTDEIPEILWADKSMLNQQSVFYVMKLLMKPCYTHPSHTISVRTFGRELVKNGIRIYNS
jgi:hypothetical protein